MSNINLGGLPPQMQARIAEIIEKAKTQVPQQQPPQQQQPQGQQVQKLPSLMDHTIALRQEVDALRNEVAAVAQVVEAVGGAVGQLYAMFQSQTQPSTYSATFQEAGTLHPGGEVSDY